MKIERSLKLWVQDGLITPEQAKRIALYEEGRDHSSWAFQSLLILGVSIIGLGIVSLVAANWIYLSDIHKLIANFALLLGSAAWIYRIRDARQTIQFEVSVLFYMFVCLASIGLHSQIFHLEGELYLALLLWSFITLPVASLSQQLPVAFSWTGGFLAAVILAIADSKHILAFYQSNLWAVAMTVPMFFVLLATASRKLVDRLNFTRALRYWSVMAAIGAIACAELNTEAFNGQTPTAMAPYIPGYVMAALIVVSFFTNKHYTALQRVLLTATLGLYVIDFHLPLIKAFPSIVHALFTLAILGLMSIVLASLKERQLFTRLIWLVGVRFLILYFQALGGLATSGIGLILSGVFVLAAVKLWIKYRAAITAKIEGWVKE